MAEKKLDLDRGTRQTQKKFILLYFTSGLLLIALSVTSTLLYVRMRGDMPQGPAIKEAIYLPLETMVVNFGGGGGSHYLQVDVQLMSHESSVIEAVETHMPIIRNDILLLLTSQTLDKISTIEGKARLRGDILAAIQKVISDQAAIRGQTLAGTVEAVYFKSFVIQ